MKNKKGFTLMELILVFVLILGLGTLVYPSLMGLDSSSKDKIYESKIELALAGAYKYGSDNIDMLSKTCSDITIGELINLDYLEGDDEVGNNLLNPYTNESMNNEVICIRYIDGKIDTMMK